MAAAPEIEQLRFMTPEQVREARRAVGTPCYVYDLQTLAANADAALAFPHAYGLTARFAMKSSPNKAILQLFDAKGLHFDCSSVFEVRRAMAAGIAPSKCSLSTQELGADFAALVELGAEVNACSLAQLKMFGEAFKGTGRGVGVRFNPGLGSGGTSKTNVGGPSSSFGIWHEQLPEVQAIVKEFGIKVVRVHTHIGSGSDPAVWQTVADLSLELVAQFPNVHTLNLGGGYKTGRMRGEPSTDLGVVGTPVQAAFEAFAAQDGRQLQLEIEPGTFLLANAGAVVTSVQDKVTTGAAGYTFLKLDAGMTDVLRPSLYGAQHPLVVVKGDAALDAASGALEAAVVVGHCCESGDLLSCAPGDPETLAARTMLKAERGDLLVVEGAGAYCAAMSTKHYNSFPEAPELVLDAAGALHVVRVRQPPADVYQNELPLPAGLFK